MAFGLSIVHDLKPRLKLVAEAAFEQIIQFRSVVDTYVLAFNHSDPLKNTLGHREAI